MGAHPLPFLEEGGKGKLEENELYRVKRRLATTIGMRCGGSEKSGATLSHRHHHVCDRRRGDRNGSPKDDGGGQIVATTQAMMAEQVCFWRHYY